MRLGVLSTSYPTRDDDASGRFVKEMAEALEARGHAVEVLFPEHAERDHPRGGRPSLVPLAYFRPRSLERTFYGAGVPDNVAREPLLALPGLVYSARLLGAAARRARAWDGVVAHFLLPSGLAAVALGRPCVLVSHSADLHLLERTPGRRLIARLLDARARLWFVSEDARARYERLLGRTPRVEPIVAPMGVTQVSPTPRALARRRLGLPADALVVASLARLVPVKGLEVAVDALVGRDDAVLLVGGEGPLAAALAERARRRGVRLRLLGPQGDAGKRDLFGAADVYVAPSRVLPSGRTEGVPVSMLEALSAGLPVVASRVGGVAARFADEPSVKLVPEGDPAALRRELERAASAPRRPLSSPGWDALALEIEASLRTGEASRAPARAQGRTTSVFRGGE